VHKNLENLLSPKSIAVIGASSTPQKVGAIVLNNIIASKFPGRIYPVNPNSQEIHGLQCYPHVTGLPEVVDLAVIAIPAGLVNQVLTEIGLKGIRNVVVFSAGYREIGPEGEAMEAEMMAIANKYSLNILGPNCLGFVNNTTPVNVTFGEPVYNQGNLRFVSQSGALAASLFDFCNATGLGFSEFITLGNKSVVNENDVLAYFLNKDRNADGAVHPIGLYLESISSGVDFLQITKDLSRKNPIFIIKPGKSTAAIKAMQSHTGAIAGEDIVFGEALEEAGVIRCDTLEDYFDLSRAFAWVKAPEGPKVAIVSNAGGPGVISADAVVSNRLDLVDFDKATQEKLHQVLPRFASVVNPVDVMGDALADRIAKACEIILQTNQAHSLMVILTPQVMTQIEKTAELIGNLGRQYNIPIFCSFIGGSLIAHGEQKLNEYHVPSFRFPERAISTIAKMWKWKQWQNTTKPQVNESGVLIADENKKLIQEIVDKAVANNQVSLDNIDANQLLVYAGIPAPQTEKVANLDEAKNFAAQNRWPVVLKLSSPGLLHKADIGAIVKDIASDDELETAMNNLKNKIVQLPTEIREHVTMQIQKDILSGIEVIVGVKRDPNFGPVLLFGAGGSLAELIMDRNLHLLPLDLSLAKEIVMKSKIYPLLKGYRGEPMYALEKLYDVILRLSTLLQMIPEASEIEINPLIVTLNDVWAVDGKVVLTRREPKPVIALPKFRVAETVEATNLAGKYHYFVFDAEGPIDFKPGQYVSIKVANTRINSYSIANKEEQSRFGLLVDTAPGGPGSIYFENLKLGDKISFLGPFGVFTYKPDDSKHIVFLATGSGVSPLKCMIDDLLKVQNVQTPITLYLGLRYQSDIFWEKYFERLSQDYPNFRFVLVISKPDEGWHGKTGHITEVVAQDFPDASQVSAYLCGNKMMIEETSNILISHGARKERVYTEKF
jgi:acetate---CoA ligase (ADP-forming)